MLKELDIKIEYLAILWDKDDIHNLRNELPTVLKDTYACLTEAQNLYDGSLDIKDSAIVETVELRYKRVMLIQALLNTVSG